MMKLDLDLVPQSCWFSNVRSEVTKQQWDKIRHEAYAAAGHVCQICGGIGPKHPVEAHEIWEYDETSLKQKLVGIEAICASCHSVHHYGLSKILGKEKEALAHFMKINKITKSKALSHIDKKFEEWKHRSQLQWELDISFLERYGINVQEIQKAKRKTIR